MKQFLFIILAFCLTSCIITNAPGFYSGYKKLNEQEKEMMKFIPADSSILSLYDNQFIYSINGNQLRNCLKENDTSLVYFWSPHCSNENCI